MYHNEILVAIRRSDSLLFAHVICAVSTVKCIGEAVRRYYKSIVYERLRVS